MICTVSLTKNLAYILVFCCAISGEKEYYDRQFATLKSFEEVDRVVELDSTEEDDEEVAEHEAAMKISNYANIILLVIKVLWL